jgi:hypothetical protein
MTQADVVIPTEPDELRKLLKRAQGGDASTLPALRKLLQEPAAVDELGGDLAQQAALSLIAAAAGKNLMFKEALTRKLELLRAELAGPSPAPVERLLVERVVACWLQVQDADVRYAQARDLSLAWGEHYQRRMDRAHKRYLSALKTLALVRRLALPVLLVNSPGRQPAPDRAGDERQAPARQLSAPGAAGERNGFHKGEVPAGHLP